MPRYYAIRGKNTGEDRAAQTGARRAAGVELMEVTPLVWRRIVVPNQWTITALHHYLQWVMG